MLSSQQEKLSDRLNLAITRKQITASDLARAAGVNRGYISLLRKGKRTNPSPAVLERLAAYLGVSVDWLLTGNGEMESNVIREEPATGYMTRATDDYWDDRFVDFAGNWLLTKAPPQVFELIAKALMEDGHLATHEKLELLSVVKRELDRRQRAARTYLSVKQPPQEP